MQTVESPSEYGLSIVLPCLNEAKAIAAAITQAKQALANSRLPGEVLVADNGSNDGSRELAIAHGARVIEVPDRGYGAALRRGFESARFEFIAMADSDLSYPLTEIPRLCLELKQGGDFILGNRLRGEIAPNAMPALHRYLGTPVLSFCLRWRHGIPTYDCNSGMRVFRRSHVLAMDLRSSGMELASEMLVRAAQMKLNYREVEIPFFNAERFGKSHLRTWRDGWRHLCLILKS